jgi:hypothetical protein
MGRVEVHTFLFRGTVSVRSLQRAQAERQSRLISVAPTYFAWVLCMVGGQAVFALRVGRLAGLITTSQDENKWLVVNVYLAAGVHEGAVSLKFKQHPKSSAQVAPFDVVGGFAEHAAGGAFHAAIDGDFDLAALVFLVAFVWADLGECQQGRARRLVRPHGDVGAASVNLIAVLEQLFLDANGAVDLGGDGH